ncbi:hypothetical protein [Marinobacterium arenosum]|uniref:hypothetical protein n=1 Tax=Marinobacterium arenosum TaxID=2862496 RepID=UPI001C969B93|nr:hypothetical protein [Marinobacterium arenosum]MBY4677930.1 hypothetical protein [Marinobacterium arenosum]
MLILASLDSEVVAGEEESAVDGIGGLGQQAGDGSSSASSDTEIDEYIEKANEVLQEKYGDYPLWQWLLGILAALFYLLLLKWLVSPTTNKPNKQRSRRT